MATITAGGAISAALRNIEPGWRGAPGAMVAVVVVGALNQLVGSSNVGLSLVMLIVGLAVSTMATGALYRLALQADHPGDPLYRPGPMGFQWSGFEWRILGANLLLGVIIGVAVVAVSLVWMLFLGIMLTTHLIDPGVMNQMNAVADPWGKLAIFFGGVGGVINILLLLAAALAIIWLFARLLLLPIGAAETGRIDLGAAWALSRSSVWPIVTTLIVRFLIGAAIALVLTYFTGMIIGKDAGAILSAMLTSAIWAPIGAGLVAYAYRAGRAPDPAVAQVFA
jgi:hypothetical protein